MRNKPHVRNRCGAKTRAGTPCKNGAMANGRCRLHGGKSTGAPPDKMKKNSNARTHGLFAKYLPDETLEIMNSINNINPLEILWTNIQMQFASIIRAQQIMFVYNENDVDRFVTKEKKDDFGIEKQYEIHTAWDKQATFMNSLSRSMAELRNMLKQYVELSTHDDDRLLEIKRMQSSIHKLEKETEFIEERTKGIKGEKKDTGLLEALTEGRKRYEQMMKESENNE